ncbi:MAG: 50S ribosomal protein L11 methyltransferase [Paracoccaceae bacterium]
MRTYSALTTVRRGDAAARLAEAMERLEPSPTGIGTFELEDGSGIWEVGGYFTEPPDETALALLAAAFSARPFAVSRIDDRDWVAQVRRELTPVEAGRFVVFGRHDRDRIPVNRIGLEIEAAMAFGTGHHATTLGCLLALDGLARKGFRARRPADIGCGSGVLAMAAAKLWHCPVVASDIDPVATATARANCRANGLRSRIVCLTAPGFRHGAIRAAAPFDLVFSNILAGPLRRLAGDMAAHVRRGGVVILSGILARQAPGVEAVYRGHGFARLSHRVIGDWTTLALRR